MNKKELNVTCAVMFLTPSKQVLIVHPNGGPWGGWSFPKGIADEGEVPAIAAARELFEETGLYIDPLDLIDIGRFSYIPHKDYHLFLYKSTWEPDILELICESTFTSRDGHQIPEVDSFKLVSLKEAVTLLNKKQSAILEAFNFDRSVGDEEWPNAAASFVPQRLRSNTNRPR